MLTAQLTLTPHLSEVAAQSLREIAAQDPAEDTLEDARLIAAGGIGLAMTLAGDVFDAEDAARRAFAKWPRGQEGFSADPTTYMLSGLLNMVELYDEGLA